MADRERGERVDLLVGPFSEGEIVPIEALPYNRGVKQKRSERFATLVWHVGGKGLGTFDSFHAGISVARIN